MQIDLAAQQIVVFLLVSTRMVATLSVAPPFNGGLVPVRIRAGLAVSIGILIASNPIEPASMVALEIPTLVVQVASQVLIGLTFGFFIQLLFSAFQIAGSAIDLSTGLSAGSLYDPTTQSQSAPIGRLYQMVSLALLVVLDGHLLIIRGVIRSWEAAPLGTLNVNALGPALSHGTEQLFIAALEVSFPVLAALLLTEIALAVASRAAPKMNIMAIGFGVKSLVLFIVLGIGLPVIANATSRLLEDGLRSGAGLIGG